jgi:hypothetical protein
MNVQYPQHRALSIFITACVLTFTVAIWAQSPAEAEKDPAANDARSSHSGFWKAVVPTSPADAEFSGYDPIGLESGVKIQADCSINWIDPDDGKRYCFSSGTSLVSFTDGPKGHIERARKGLEDISKPASPKK